LLDTLSYTELLDWIEYFSIYPFSQDRADIRAAILSYHIVRGYVDTKTAKKLKIEQFMPKFEKKEAKKQTWQTQLAIVEQLNLALNGRDERRDIKKHDP